MLNQVGLVKFKGTLKDVIHSCSYSRVAYVEPSKLSSLVRDRFRDHELISCYDMLSKSCSKDSHAYLLKRGQELICTFRGTMTRDDIKNIVDLRHLRLQNGAMLHRGFYERFLCLESKLTVDLLKLINSGTGIDRVRFVGHSMGGAVAIIAAGHYSTLAHFPDTTCHTFGSPMFSDKFMTDTIRTNTKHQIDVHMTGDVVPRIPIHNSFTHMPNVLELTETGIPSCLLDRRASHHHFMDTATKIRSWDDILKQHSCEIYFNALSQCYNNVRLW